MLSTFGVVFPIFALILVGYVSRRINALGPAASRELNRFVVILALPAMLFDIMAHATWAAVYQPGFIAAFGLSCTAVFALTMAVRLRAKTPLADASIDGLNASYGNVGYIGIPLCLIALGPDSQTRTAIAAIFTACILFGGAIILVEIGLQAEKRVALLALKVARSLLRNPLLIASALGALIAASGFSIPDNAEVFVHLLGGAASPCALVALRPVFRRKEQGDRAQGRDGRPSHRAETHRPAGHRLVSGGQGFRPVADRYENSGSEGRAADRDGSLHARRILPA